MFLPFASIVAKVFFCSLADRHRAYRLLFIIFLFTALLGYGSFGILPFFIDRPSKDRGLELGRWILIGIMCSVATISMGVISSLSDAFAVNSAKKNKTNYGFIRVWGTLGWGASSLLLGFINETDKLPFLVPGLIMTIAFISLELVINISWRSKSDFELDMSASDVGLEDVVSAVTQNNQRADASTVTIADCKVCAQDYGTIDENDRANVIDATSFKTEVTSTKEVSDLKIQWILFKEVAKRRPSLFRYMTLFVISGALISLQWSYLFLYLKNIYSSNFTFISSLSMVGQSLCGELPFFILSKIIIKRCGRNVTLSISIISIGIRYLMYQYLLPNASMYFILLTESLAGPGFGLFYVVMTGVGLDYSDCEGVIVKIINDGIVDNSPAEIQRLRQALRATMQSLMSACYEGFGVGIGSVVGGVVIDQYGFRILWLYSSSIAIILGLTNLVIEFCFSASFADREARPTSRPTRDQLQI